MRNKKILIMMLVCAMLVFACDYIVTPEFVDTPEALVSKGWTAVVTNVAQTGAGDLHIDLTIRNETGDWSAMQAINGKPAVLTASDGKTVNCDTVFVGTGGHRLAPGFQMRGYTAGTKQEPAIQPLYVECKGVETSPGARLAIAYSYVTGEYNYFEQDATRTEARLDADIDQVAVDLNYPIYAQVSDLILAPDLSIEAINKNILTLSKVARTETGLQFTWLNTNPTEYPLYVHIGLPPVIGADGILYGFYESPDIASPPITPAGSSVEWTTDVAVPQEVGGFYILLSVESKKQRLFVNYAIDISDQ